MKMSKRLLSIVLTGIMVMSVFTAWVPMVGAEPSTIDMGNRTGIVNLNNSVSKSVDLYLGERVNFTNATADHSIIGKAPDDIEGVVYGSTDIGTIQEVSSVFDTSYSSASYYVDMNDNSTYDANDDILLSVKKPSLSFTPKAKEGNEVKTVSSITEGTRLILDLVENLPDNDCFDVVITGPNGRVRNDAGNFNDYAGTLGKSAGENIFDNVSLGGIIATFGKSTGTKYGINTTGWTLGTYTIKLESKSENARGLDISTEEKTIKILKSEIDISADTTSPVENQIIKLTVTGTTGHKIQLSVVGGCGNAIFPDGMENNKEFDYDTCTMLNDTIDADGTRTYAVKFNDTGSYTIKVYDWNATTAGEKYETLDITVSSQGVEFDVPSVVTIGEKFDLRGTATEDARWVDIAIDDVVKYQLQVEDDGSFSEEVDTGSEDVPSDFKVKGSVRLDAYIDPDRTLSVDGTVPSAWDKDGSVAILMIKPGLTAELSATQVAVGDDFTVSGTAPGAKDVDILLVAPKGGGGNKITDPKTNGIDVKSASVSETDHSFEKKITVDEDVDTGTYVVGVLSPGQDGKYGKTTKSDILEAVGTYTGLDDLSSKDQNDILSILTGMTTEPGVDDLVWVGYLVVEEQRITIDTPIPDVAIGDDLVVTGTSNRPSDQAIIVTVSGPVELTPQTVYPANGTWTATFDTSGAEVGVYTVKADDGDRTVQTTVNIVSATATATPTATETVTETPTAVPTTATATETATATATPEETATPPGFEAIFALAGLFAVAFLVARKR